MVNLGDYLKANDLTAEEFGRQLGVSRVSVQFWLRGKKKPSRDMAFKIEALTKGVIPARDWFDSAAPIMPGPKPSHA